MTGMSLHDWASQRAGRAAGLHRRDPQVPTTNNRSEQAIGRFRIRARAMRGIQSWAGLEAAPASPTSRWPGGVQAHTRSRAPAFTSSRRKIANRTCDSNPSWNRFAVCGYSGYNCYAQPCDRQEPEVQKADHRADGATGMAHADLNPYLGDA
jgi:hypothetical protein